MFFKYLRIFEKFLSTFHLSSRTLKMVKMTLVCLWKKMLRKKGLLTQPSRMLIPSNFLANGTIISHLLLFYLYLEQVCKKNHRFVQYTPMKCFSNFVQSAVHARKKGDENPLSSVVAETMKLLANNSYGHQIIDRSRRRVKKCLIDGKTLGAKN